MEEKKNTLHDGAIAEVLYSERKRCAAWSRGSGRAIQLT